MHECEVCGMYCDCDGEDMHNPQPDNCVHLIGDCLEEYDDEMPATESLDDDGVWVDTGVPARTNEEPGK